MSIAPPVRDSFSSTPPIPFQPRRGYRIAQAAEYIGCTPWYCEEAIRQHRLKATKMGRAWVVFIEDLNTFIDQEKSKVNAA